MFFLIVVSSIAQQQLDTIKKSVDLDELIVSAYKTEELKRNIASQINIILSKQIKFDNPQTTDDESKVVTTEEEMEAFLIVKTILRQQIPASRIAFRDAQSYFAILLDDNNRKTICRLYLNGNKKFIGLFDEQRKETKTEILSLDDIFNHSTSILKTIEIFDKTKETN